METKLFSKVPWLFPLKKKSNNNNYRLSYFQLKSVINEKGKENYLRRKFLKATKKNPCFFVPASFSFFFLLFSFRFFILKYWCFFVVLISSGNPITCDCEQQELWEWLQDHRKLIGLPGEELKCESPSEVRGFSFVELSPPEFCTIPLVPKLAIQDIQPFSIVVSWQSRNHSGFHGYDIIYTDLEANETVRTTNLSKF